MGNDRMKEIASYIREGAMAFLMREYRTVAIFIVVMFLLLLFLPGLGLPIAVTFLMGACFSILAGFFGMSHCSVVGSGYRISFSGQEQEKQRNRRRHPDIYRRKI